MRNPLEGRGSRVEGRGGPRVAGATSGRVPACQGHMRHGRARRVSPGRRAGAAGGERTPMFQDGRCGVGNARTPSLAVGPRRARSGLKPRQGHLSGQDNCTNRCARWPAPDLLLRQLTPRQPARQRLSRPVLRTCSPVPNRLPGPAIATKLPKGHPFRDAIHIIGHSIALIGRAGPSPRAAYSYSTRTLLSSPSVRRPKHRFFSQTTATATHS